MKASILLLSIFLSLASCSKDSASSGFQLPPVTQTGANTFGVTIKGKVYIPRDPTGVNVGVSGHGMALYGASDYSWYELRIKDGASAVGFQMYIHMQPLASVGQIMLHQSNFHNGIDSTPFSHIYFEIWDSAISNYAYYGSVENQAEINITKLAGGILSGNFKGKFVRYDNPNDFIQITDGRFDINGFTLPNTVFP
jgi:hypothetical protein